MKVCLAALSVAAVLAAAPLSSALSYEGRYTAYAPYEMEMLGGYDVYPSRSYPACPMNSAAEGNANQQNFPTQQYGQTSGGNRC